MIRRLLVAMCALSLLLCITALIFWVRGRSWDEEFRLDGYKLDGGTPSRIHSITILSDGHVGLGYEHFTPNYDLPPSDPLHGLQNAPEHYEVSSTRTPHDSSQWWPTSWWNRLGFRFYDLSDRSDGVAGFYGYLPYWFLAVVTAMPPLVLAWTAWRVRRRSANQCLACGYDLRASKDRCPECGTPIPSIGGTPG